MLFCLELAPSAGEFVNSDKLKIPLFLINLKLKLQYDRGAF